MTEIRRISFVWNADFNLAGGVRALRELAGGEHSCTLCAIAYHRVRQTGDWKDYKRELAQRYRCEVREPCRNQLQADEAAAAAGHYPCVLVRTDREVVQVLDSRAIDACAGGFHPFRTKLDAAVARLQSDLWV